MEPPGLLLFGMLFIGVLLVLGMLWFISRAKAYLRGEPFLTAQRFQQADGSVKSYPAPTPIVMSSGEPVPPPSAPSSLETDGRRAETAAPGPKFTEDQLLTLYAGLRAHGMVRDKASQILKASGIPMNNNLWAKAAPPPPAAPVEEDDTFLTPIAGRRTKASYYPDDPELEFNPPPR